MPTGRPKSDDSPGKYRESSEIFELVRPQRDSGGGVVGEVAALLEWAITGGRSGFGVGDIISIGALAEGVGKSRNTAAKSVERLVAKGMVVQPKPKSPYRIVSRTPIFEDSISVADEKISLTSMTTSESYFSEVRSCTLGDRQDPFATFLAAELDASKDPLIRDGRDTGWQEGEYQYCLRVRAAEIAGRDTAYLAEATFLRLSPEEAKDFGDRMNLLRGQDVRRISLYPVLEQCGLTDLRAGRTQISVGCPPAFLETELQGVLASSDVDRATFGADDAMLKWTYALFHPAPVPMVTFSVCFVRSELLGIFIRSLDVDLDQG